MICYYLIQMMIPLNNFFFNGRDKVFAFKEFTVYWIDNLEIR